VDESCLHDISGGRACREKNAITRSPRHSAYSLCLTEVRVWMCARPERKHGRRGTYVDKSCLHDICGGRACREKKCDNAVSATVIATCADIARAESSTHCKLRCDRHCNLRAHSKRRISDASHVRVRPSSQHACTSQAQNRRYIASCGATVIATFAHITSAGSPTHCKLCCGRHDFMHAKPDAAGV